MSDTDALRGHFEQPSTAEKPTHYGLDVWEDEDGEVLWIKGHVGKRRALAAANRYARVEQGLANLYDQPGVVIARSFLWVEHEWWAPVADREDDEYPWWECDASDHGATPFTVVRL